MTENIKIRHIKDEDAQAVIAMMRVFYASPAVHTNGSETIFRQDVETCLSDSPYLEGYVFEKDGELLGYSMLAKSFSTEFGKPCIWIEDIYLKESARSLGIGTAFFAYIEKAYPHSIFRLEVEEENERAVYVYRKCGYDTLPYMEMKKEPFDD